MSADALEDGERVRAVEMVEDTQEVDDIERAMTRPSDAANVVQFELQSRQTSFGNNARSLVHPFAAAVDGDDLGTAERRLDAIDSFAAGKIEDSQLIERFGREVSCQLHHPSNLYAVRIALLDDRCPTLRTLLCEKL